MFSLFGPYKCVPCPAQALIQLHSCILLLLSVTVSEVTSCGEVDIEDSAQSVYPGGFTLTGQLLNSRPVYQHANAALYLYFYQDSDCAFWAVSGAVGAKTAVMYAYDASISPENITGTFTTVGEDGVFVVDDDNSIKTTCLTPT